MSLTHVVVQLGHLLTVGLSHRHTLHESYFKYIAVLFDDTHGGWKLRKQKKIKKLFESCNDVNHCFQCFPRDRL